MVEKKVFKDCFPQFLVEQTTLYIHDVNSPLCALSGYSEFLQEDLNSLKNGSQNEGIFENLSNSIKEIESSIERIASFLKEFRLSVRLPAFFKIKVSFSEVFQILGLSIEDEKDSPEVFFFMDVNYFKKILDSIRVFQIGESQTTVEANWKSPNEILITIKIPEGKELAELSNLDLWKKLLGEDNLLTTYFTLDSHQSGMWIDFEDEPEITISIPSIP